jgi:dual oxidase
LLFSRGKTEDKLRIIFDMCDKDSNGVIDKEELSEMLRSLVEIARTTSLSDDHVTELIDGMFQVCLHYVHFFYRFLVFYNNFPSILIVSQLNFLFTRMPASRERTISHTTTSN